MTDPPLTTVHQPSYELGATAYELLRAAASRSSGCSRRTSCSASRPAASRPLALDDHDEPARAVDALDSLRARCRTSPTGPRRGRAGAPRSRRSLEPAHELGHGLDDLVLPHDADVEIRKQRQRASPLPRPAVECDRPGDRAGRGARRERAVELVELAAAKAPRPRRAPRRPGAAAPRGPAGSRSAARPASRAPRPPRLLRRRPGARSRGSRGGDPRTPRPRVVRRRALDAVEPWHRGRRCTGDGLPHALEHDLTRGHRTPTTLGTSAPARRAGRGCAPTRAAARAGSAGSSRPRTSGFWRRRASRCARSYRGARAKDASEQLHARLLRPQPLRRHDLLALVHEERGDVDPHGTDVRAGAAKGRGERERGRRAAFRVELRLQDRADRPCIRACGRRGRPSGDRRGRR